MFLYFDLGNVLLNFDHQRACRQIAALAGLTAERVFEVLFAGGLELRYETGLINDDQLYDEFCRQTGSAPPLDALLHAASDIFEVNVGIVPVVTQLAAAGHPLGILSNTCPAHWNFCRARRYGFMHAFQTTVLSYEVGACKPDPRIFEAAAERAGVAAADIFYVDDLAANVAGARAAGLDAVQYVSPAQLVEDLRARGVRFNL